MHGFMPHGMCYLWRLDILLMHVVSDFVIGVAYFSIPLVLWIFFSSAFFVFLNPQWSWFDTFYFSIVTTQLSSVLCCL